MPRQFRLEAASVEELARKVRAEYGPRARIVRAEKVTQGGIGGFFAKELRVEALVEVPDPVQSPTAAVQFGLPERVGIAALLAEADESEDAIFEHDGQGVSTARPDFDALMSDLQADTEPVVPTRAAVPAPLRGAGDLIVLVGWGDDPLLVARAMSEHHRSHVTIGGGLSIPGYARVDDRRSAMAARAVGVERAQPAVVAFGLGRDPGQWAQALGGVVPDQVWVVVDAGRKPVDSAAWVRAVREVVPVDAVAAVGVELTSTPETVNDLGLPVAWVDHNPLPAGLL